MKLTSDSALLLVSAVTFLASGHALAAQGQDDSKNLSNLSIEELAQIPVRSASKIEEPQLYSQPICAPRSWPSDTTAMVTFV